MHTQEKLISNIAQDKIDFNIGIKLLLEHDKYNFEKLLQF